ncbi:hypothetical protein CMV_012307 [Castanea mollissima]|uniref:Uncharacterized protein n=1 Tax=Castanea mollissima TaxID=60419 RepID=A0A8J4RFP6_9ROSI|nr:hypothetical protein CMV_012307 [Castanea mollissima]
MSRRRSANYSRIGTEHEKYGFELGSLRPMRYGQIAELLNGIAKRFGWDKIMEGDNVIGLKQIDIDEKRTGMIPFVFNDSFGFERYIDYALDVPMVCVYRQKKYKN